MAVKTQTASFVQNWHWRGGPVYLLLVTVGPNSTGNPPILSSSPSSSPPSSPSSSISSSLASTGLPRCRTRRAAPSGAVRFSPSGPDGSKIREALFRRRVEKNDIGRTWRCPYIVPRKINSMWLFMRVLVWEPLRLHFSFYPRCFLW